MYKKYTYLKEKKVLIIIKKNNIKFKPISLQELPKRMSVDEESFELFSIHSQSSKFQHSFSNREHKRQVRTIFHTIAICGLPPNPL